MARDDIEGNDEEAPRREKVLIRQKCLLSAAVLCGSSRTIVIRKVNLGKPLLQIINRAARKTQDYDINIFFTAGLSGFL